MNPTLSSAPRTAHLGVPRLRRFLLPSIALMVSALCAAVAQPVRAQEAAIRKALGERVPQLQKIDEVRKAEMPGLYEVRVGTDVFYTDAKGDFLLQGDLLDTRVRRNLTEERVNQLTAVAFDALPLKDAFTIVRGKGERKVAIFEDPNCGYCKRFERELQGVDNITIHLFLYPILGADSTEKSRNLWCAKDKSAAWQDHMVRDKPIAATAACDTGALERNVAFGRKHKINGTPTLIFANGTRVPGAIDRQQIEKYLTAAAK
jgi:thiol:disulfide interchange protein DsbC